MPKTGVIHLDLGFRVTGNTYFRFRNGKEEVAAA